mmetsp:Transcript_145997/g.468149  ORF Transcript_145997/g.468149 Transcript_145997/m.468149 type:complete len:216 (+) Transcript_145997:740-1387(+)
MQASTRSDRTGGGSRGSRCRRRPRRWPAAADAGGARPQPGGRRLLSLRRRRHRPWSEEPPTPWSLTLSWNQCCRMATIALGTPAERGGLRIATSPPNRLCSPRHRPRLALSSARRCRCRPCVRRRRGAPRRAPRTSRRRAARTACCGPCCGSRKPPRRGACPSAAAPPRRPGRGPGSRPAPAGACGRRATAAASQPASATSAPRARQMRSSPIAA